MRPPANYNVSNTVTDTISITSGSNSGITWGSFSGTLVVGGAAKAPSAASGTGGTTFSYAVKTPSTCTLDDSATGEVSAKAVDLTTTQVCTVTGTAERSGYADETQDISINLGTGNDCKPGLDRIQQQ